jgi:hypothetical protein
MERHVGLERNDFSKSFAPPKLAGDETKAAGAEG